MLARATEPTVKAAAKKIILSCESKQLFNLDTMCFAGQGPGGSSEEIIHGYIHKETIFNLGVDKNSSQKVKNYSLSAFHD